MSTENPTPEEIESARAVVAAADAAIEAERRAAIQQALAPLVALGFGADSPPAVSIADIAKGLKENAAQVATVDDLLGDLSTSTSRVLITLNDRVRTLLPPPETEAS